MHIITIDFESFWNHKDYTLSKMGPIEYIRDPRFEVQLMGIRIDRGKTEVFETHEIPAVLQALDLANRKDCIVVGHNLNGFDALILSEHYGIVPHLCLDTMTISRWIGLSRLGNESHARLTKLLGTGEKKAGTVVSDGKHWPHDFTSEERKFFKQYCADDVTQCSENMHTMLESGLVTKDAILFSNIICRMGTQPIFRLVPSLLDTYVKELEERAERARLDLSRIFHFHTKEEFLQNIRSADKFCSMIRTLGMEPPMKVSAARTKTARTKLEAEYVSLSDAGYAVVNGYAGDDVKQKRINEVVGMLANPASYEVLAPALSKNDYEFVNLQNHEDDRIALLVQSRLENNSSIQMSRALRFVTLAKSGKPLPVMLNCFKAHTSRLTAGNSEGASDSINLQNLSKRNPKMLTLRRAIIAPKGYKVVAADSSQIEARLLAYIARQDDLLDKFRTGEDPYSQLAENIFNVPWKEIKAGNKAGDPRMTMYRNVGKKAILSCFEGSTLVLTNMGWVAIKDVTDKHLLWDGESWVQHEGRICNGRKTVVNLHGIYATPDHMIYTGTAWRTVSELLREPNYLRSALATGAESYGMLQSTQQQAVSTNLFTCVNVPVATNFSGCICTTWGALQKITAPPVLQGMIHILESLCRRFQIMNPVQGLVPSLLLNLEGCHQGKANYLPGMYWCNATAEQNHIGFTSITCVAEKLRAVMRALKRNPKQLGRNSIGGMPIYAPMCSTGAGCWQESPAYCNDATIPSAPYTNTTAGAASSVSLRIARNFLLTCLRWMDGIIQTMTSTAPITKDITSRGICGLSHERTMSRIGGMLQSSLTESASSKERLPSTKHCLVYDIRNAGPRHRYMVLTDEGPMLVHNCGYQVGWQKFSNSLLGDGVKLHADLDQHHQMAKHAHSVYRLTHGNIVQFWGRCLEVIRALYLGSEGTFGGPNDDYFQFKAMPFIKGNLYDGAENMAPSIRMPSGYILRYPGLHVQTDGRREEFFYKRPFGKNMVDTKIYGGLLCENLIQGLAFQLLMWQACRMYEHGIPLKANVHDAWITVVPEADAERVQSLMEADMSSVPDWLPGFPVACDSKVGDDYTIA